MCSLRIWLTALLLSAAGLLSVQAQTVPKSVLWITGDITPAARTALVERLGAAAGLAVQHLDYPLRGASDLSPAEQTALRNALRQAALVWVDAPHASVLARLRSLLGPTLATFEAAAPGRVVWVAPETASGVAKTPAERMASYLQTGGERNVRHAVALGRALLLGQVLPVLPAAEPWPVRGVYHPQAPGLMADAAAFARWQQDQPALRNLPPVAVLVHRYHFVNGTTDWLDAWLRRFQDQGLAAYAVFGQQVDPTGLAALLELPDERGAQGTPRPHARAIVTHQLLPQGAALQPLFTRWRVPVLATQIYRQGDVPVWERDETGLTTADVPFYLAQPEAAGTVDPVLVAAQTPRGLPVLIARQADAVVAKVRRLLVLQNKPMADKKLVAMVYNYPPGGSNFGASFLNVPRSLEQVSQGLQEAGYSTRRVAEADWISGLQPLLSAYYDGADLAGMLARNQADALPLARYEAWWATLPAPVRERIAARWGNPAQSRYVVRWQGEKVFVIPRLQVGNLSVLPQPPREETLNRGQNPFAHRSKTPLSHHYLAVYLWAGQADALVHFGTHGTQEWAPGKARALDVWDDALLPLASASDHIPVVYPYIVDNLGEALTAKRRGRAVLVSHRTPQFAPAGFEARMAHMHEVMHEWETVDAGPTKQALERQLTAQFVEHQLHRDLGWTAERIAAHFEGFLELLHPYLDQLAQSSQPQGLAVFGRVPDALARQQTILQTLRKPLIDALGEDIDEAFLINHQSVATARPARWLSMALRDAQAASVLDLRPPLAPTPATADKLVRADDFVPNRAARQPIDTPALFKLAERAQQLETLLATEGELPGLLAALNGRFIPAAYGGDPIRNPDSLPTGRNLTGLDPSRLPTRQAYAVAQTLFNDWLKDWRQQHQGQVPGRMALSLWAGETLRHQGVMEAQALVALGVRPVWDESGRPVRIEVIGSDELKRPRVDVLLSITGSYRDQFPALMGLIDQAVATAASAEPGVPNAVARNTAQVAAALRQRGLPLAQAQALARARVFGNAVGDYGTGISDAVQSDGLKREGMAADGSGGEDKRLGELFLNRMSQPYVDGQPLSGVPAAAAVQALGAHLRQTDAAVLSRSSHLFAMVTSDDPFQYLGGLAAAARSAGKKDALGLYVSQLQDASEPTTDSAQRSIALEMQSRYLHPGWLQAQKAEGYAGTLQVLKAVQFTWGWQAVAPDTVRPDHWQSFFDVLVKDKHQLGLPQWLKSHPQAYAQTLERLVQAQRLGYWKADAATQQQLASLYNELTQQAPLANPLASVQRWAGQDVAPVQAPPAASARPSEATPTARSEPVPPPVRGVLLQRQPDATPAVLRAALLAQLLALVAMALVVVCGAAWQRGKFTMDRHPNPLPT